MKGAREKIGSVRRCVSIFARRPKIGVHVWIPSNPYSDMLYKQFRGATAPQPMTLLEELAAFTMLPAAGRLLWIHSEASYSWGRHGQKLDAAYASYIRSLERWSAKNGKLVWTIHDDGLHLNDPDSSRIIRIRSKLGEMADCIHVHSEAAKKLVVSKFGLMPERIMVVPHPSYASLYPTPLYEFAAANVTTRRRLLCFGHIKRYKNYDALAAALNGLGSDSFSKLTIAGKPDGDIVLPVSSLRRNLELDLKLGFVPDSDVPDLFAMADFLILPYEDTLTSGAVALSMGFGVPVIAPDLGGMREAVPAANGVLLYSPGDPDGLENALRLARDMSAEEYSNLAKSCHEFGEAIHPDVLSLRLLNSLIERGVYL